MTQRVTAERRAEMKHNWEATIRAFYFNTPTVKETQEMLDLLADLGDAEKRIAEQAKDYIEDHLGVLRQQADKDHAMIVKLKGERLSLQSDLAKAREEIGRLKTERDEAIAKQDDLLISLHTADDRIATLEAQLADARAAALEEAAKECDIIQSDYVYDAAHCELASARIKLKVGEEAAGNCASAIRALKPKGPQG